jgi:quercetin dioxygenase-like cupin family protein
MSKHLPVIENFRPAINSRERIEMRQIILESEKNIAQAIEDGQLTDIADQAILTHYFTPIHEEYRCCVYGRKVVIPKGSVTFGKIHRHATMTVVLKGKGATFTEAGKIAYEAGDVFIAEAGTKRVGMALEDTLWLTVHLTKFGDESHIDEIEDELIAENYEEIGLLSTAADLELRRAIEDFTAMITEGK